MSLSGQLTSLINAEEARAKQFEQYLTAADNETDGDIDVAALNRAESLASSEEEKGRAYLVRRRHSQWESGVITDQTTQMLAKLNGLRERLTVVENGEPNEATSQAISVVLEQLQGLPDSFPRASAASIDQVSSTKTRATSLRSAVTKRLSRMRTERSSMKSIFDANSLDLFASGLRDFASKSPESPMATEFNEAAGERLLWEKALAWNGHVANMRKALRANMTQELIADVSASGSLVDSQIGSNLLNVPMNARARFARHSERETILNTVLGELPKAVIANLFTVNGNGKRYFIDKSFYDKERKRMFATSEGGNTASRGIEIIANNSGAIKTKAMSGNLVVHQEPYDTIQSFADLDRSQILLDWDGEFLKLAAKLRARKNLDGSLKEMLLRNLLTGACSGSEYLSKNLRSELKWMNLRTGQVDLWYEPADPNNDMVDFIETRVVPKLSQLYKNRSTLGSEYASLKTLTYQRVGFLSRTDDGKIVIRLTQTPKSDCNLAIVRPSVSTKGKVDWVAIGQVESGLPELSRSIEGLTAGRPVFSYPR